LVVTDDFAVRETIESAGACFQAASVLANGRSKLADLERDIKYYNQKERLKFTRSAQS